MRRAYPASPSHDGCSRVTSGPEPGLPRREPDRSGGGGLLGGRGATGLGRADLHEGQPDLGERVAEGGAVGAEPVGDGLDQGAEGVDGDLRPRRSWAAGRRGGWRPARRGPWRGWRRRRRRGPTGSCSRTCGHLGLHRLELRPGPRATGRRSSEARAGGGRRRARRRSGRLAARRRGSRGSSSTRRVVVGAGHGWYPTRRQLHRKAGPCPHPATSPVTPGRGAPGRCTDTARSAGVRGRRLSGVRVVFSAAGGLDQPPRQGGAAHR